MYLGIDIGGSKTLLAAFNKDGTIAEQKLFKTPTIYQDFLTVLSKTIKELTYKNFEVAAIAIPGRLDRKQGIGLGFGTLPWQNVPIVRDITDFVKCLMVIENDARLASLAEASLLGKDYEKILYFTVSNGIGGGLVINGQIDQTLRDSEFGSMIFPHEGAMVRWEEFASGRAIVKRFGQKLSEINDQPTLKIIGEDIALGIIAACSAVQADIVILGGGAGGNLEHCMPYIKTFLDEYLFPTIKKPELVIAKHPEKATILGTYLLAKNFKETGSKIS
jgi:predicted NBD/HSP70 family sugar kinase